MDYNELNLLIKRKFSSLKEFCSAIGISANGFRKGVETNTLGMRYISATCNALGITPNEFFGWEEPVAAGGNYASHVTGGNTQNSNEAIKALKDQLKEKDRQISRLLSMLENLNGTGGKADTVIPYMAAEDNGYKTGKGKK